MRVERFEQPVQQVLPVRHRIAEGQLFRLSETFFYSSFTVREQ